MTHVDVALVSGIVDLYCCICESSCASVVAACCLALAAGACHMASDKVKNKFSTTCF